MFPPTETYLVVEINDPVVPVVPVVPAPKLGCERLGARTSTLGSDPATALEIGALVPPVTPSKLGREELGPRTSTRGSDPATPLEIGVPPRTLYRIGVSDPLSGSNWAS